MGTKKSRQLKFLKYKLNSFELLQNVKARSYSI